jgi:tellurite resistance protein
MIIHSQTIERLRDALLASGRRAPAIQSSAFETLARAGLLSEKERAALLRVEPLAEVMFLVIAADEMVAESELAAIVGAVRGMSGDALTDGTIKVMIDSFALRLRDQGALGRLRELGTALRSDQNDAESAFCLAAAVALADNAVADSESRVLDELASVLGFSESDRQRILGQLAQDKGQEAK